LAIATRWFLPATTPAVDRGIQCDACSGFLKPLAGFRWVFDLPTAQVFDEPLVFALRDALLTAAEAHG
jgi:hypothetical protein